MARALSDLLNDVLNRVEEAQPPAGPVFWNLTGEVYPSMVDGIFEAALITGVVQLVSQQITLAPDTTWFRPPSLQEQVTAGWIRRRRLRRLCGSPSGHHRSLRMKAPDGIRKTSSEVTGSHVPALGAAPRSGVTDHRLGAA